MTAEEKNLIEVQKYLKSLAATEPIAGEAARILDAVLGLHKDPKCPFDARTYLNGSPLHDASILRAFAIEAAKNSGVSLTEIVDYAYKAIATVLRLANVASAIFAII